MIELPRIRPFLGRAIQPVLVDSRVEAPGGYGFPPPAGTTDGGGWWEWTIEGMQAFKPQHVKILRAFAARIRGGEVVRIPVIDDPQRLSPLPEGVPFSDDAPFSDDSLFNGGSVDAFLEGGVGLRDDEAIIKVRSGQLLTGGELFSLERGAKGPELKLINWMEPLGLDRYQVRLAPNFRQAHLGGSPCNFDEPAFAATVPDTSTLWPKYGLNWIGEASVTFVEAP